MHNLIKSRALFEILKTPLPELHFTGQNSDDSADTDDTLEPDQSESLPLRSTVLNVNANEFVPSSKRSSGDLNLGVLKRYFESLDEQKFHSPMPEELMLPKSSYKMPQLILPWKGFPKRLRVERSARYSTRYAPAMHNDCHLGTRLKPTRKDKLPTTIKTILNNSNNKKSKNVASVQKEEAGVPPVVNKKLGLAEKRREHERKVALEALKLVEQRRKREPIAPLNVDAKEQQQVDVAAATKIVHLSRSPVRFTPRERERVDRLREIKRQRIERVLREMQKEQQLEMLNISAVLQPADAVVKPPKPSEPVARHFISANRPLTEASKPKPDKDNLPESVPPKRYITLHRAKSPAAVEAGVKPKRYIPTTKEWDLQCKAKMEQEAKENKENMIITTEMLEQLNNNAKLNARAKALSTRKLPQPQTQQPALTETSANANKPSGELLARRQRLPPAQQQLTNRETRRGNLTHAHCLASAFSKCEAIPIIGSNMAGLKQQQLQQAQHATQIDAAVRAAVAIKKPIKRYSIAKLLELEPLPAQLVSPNLDETLLSFGLLYDLA